MQTPTYPAPPCLRRTHAGAGKPGQLSIAPAHATEQATKNREKPSRSPQSKRLRAVCAPLLRVWNRPLLTQWRVRMAKAHGSSWRSARLATQDSPVLLSEWSPPPQDFWVTKSAARFSAPAPRLKRGFASVLCATTFYPVVFGEFSVLCKLV